MDACNACVTQRLGGVEGCLAAPPWLARVLSFLVRNFDVGSVFSIHFIAAYENVYCPVNEITALRSRAAV
eukprot:4347901-Pleurochrysis_carterae.AAC.1